MMVNKVILCICAGFMALLPLAAQSVSGTVTDEKNLPLEEITVVALQAPDSLYITGGVTNGNGEFHIRISHSGKYMLKLSGIGFQTKYIAFSLSADQKKQLGSILLKEDAYLLSGVTVTAKKPEMELTSSSTVINLASSSLGSQGTLFDALKRLPGVQVKDDGTILLNGQSGATVMLNGKPTYLSGSNLATYLQAIPASSIGKIELISMPSSRYEASGKSGIIKVEMAKNNVQGFLVGFNSSYQQLDQYGKGNTNWMFQLRKNKLNISANYSYYEGTDINPTFIVRDHTDYAETPVVPVILNQDAHRTYNYGSHYARTRVDYDLSSRLSVGAYVSKNWTDRVRKERMNSVFTSTQAAADSTLMTWNKNKLSQTNLQGGADYSYNITSKLQWTGSVDFQSYRASDKQDQNSLYNDYWQGNYEQADTLRGKLRDNIDIVSTQSDVEFVLTKTLKLTGGVKASFVNIDNETTYSDRYNGAWTPKLNMNKDFQCGTGHGFGYLGSIHEPPTGFRWYIVPSKNEHHQFEPGMVITDEPGIYEEGDFGIRIENNLLTVNGEKNKYGQFMHFETLNFVPIDLDGIDPEELTRSEKEWLNDYHKACYEKVGPYLTDEEREWLKEYTRAI